MTTPEQPGYAHQPPAAPPAPERYPAQQPQYTQPPYGYAPTVQAAPPAPTSKPKGLAVAALIVGIVAFLVGWIPWVGLIIGIAAVVLGTIALIKRQSKALSITGTVLGAIALVTSLITSLIFGAVLSSESSRPVPAPPAAHSSEKPAVDEPEPVEPEPAAPVTPDLAAFAPVDDRTFALIAKEPDAHIGTQLIVFGNITQLDAATGKCGALISTAAGQKEASYEYEQNVMASAGDFDTDCPVFDPLVEGDNVKLWATVLGSLSYDTQIGGNTTVPHLMIWQAELLPATEY